MIYFAGAVPVAALAAGLLWVADFETRTKWTLALAALLVWGGCALLLREKLIRPLQTLANLLESLRQEDYSMRARRVPAGDVLGEVFQEVNLLSGLLREKRLGDMDTTALLRTVMAEIDVGIFAFDAERRLRLVNRAGARLLGQTTERLLGQSAEALDLDRYLEGETERMVERAFPGGSGRWSIRVRTFREHGEPHLLVVVADLTRTLREEELQAWKRLVRVLGHELNNSLTPIKSIAGSLKALVSGLLPEDWNADTVQGLSVIEARAAALNRFLEAYAKLAKLPPPKFGHVDVGEWVRRAASLERSVRALIVDGDPLVIEGDSDQLDQLLINLLRNAADAARETGGGVDIGWALDRGVVHVWIRDEGPGISNSGNLFVPFFTTKPGGSGIGLVVSRQIAEAHGGTLVLRNRADRRGSEALLTLPVSRYKT